MTSPVPDPAARAEELGERVDVASARALATAAGISDEQAREPSSLPGWSRGHLLTHLARNADGLRNLLIWARTGVVTPQYPSVEARDEEIEAGAGRPARELAADVAGSATAFAAETRRRKSPIAASRADSPARLLSSLGSDGGVPVLS